MSITAIVLIILLGIILLLVEFLIIPGVTVAGIAGIVLMAAGVFAAYKRSADTGNITLIGTLFFFIVIIVIAVNSKTWKAVMLKNRINGKAINVKEESGLKVGDRGKTVTRLNPIGKAMFNDVITEAKSLGSYVDENTEVEIIKVQNNNVVVKPLKS